MKKEQAILFSDKELQAILDGRKTQFRITANSDICPYAVDDILWVKEKYAKLESSGSYAYFTAEENEKGIYKWLPASGMPKKAARIFLRITGIRKEKLQNISEEDAKAEGVDPITWQSIGMGYMDSSNSKSYRTGFYKSWRLSKIKSLEAEWKNNPDVWVITFELWTVTIEA